jgi:hypothetical protein
MKKLIVFLMTLALCACLLMGCSGAPEVDENVSKSSSFVIVEDGDCYYIVYHKDTRVMYSFSTSGSNYGSLCLLVNADGTPMVWEGE